MPVQAENELGKLKEQFSQAGQLLNMFTVLDE